VRKDNRRGERRTEPEEGNNSRITMLLGDRGEKKEEKGKNRGKRLRGC
jgi:hypothetical protein